MSVPEGTKPWWPLRPAGFALLGLAAVAAATGLVLVVSDDGSDAGSGRGPATSGHAPGSTSAAPSAAPSPHPTATSPATPAPAPPPAPVPPAGSTPGTPPPAPPAPPAPAPAGPATPAPGTDSDVAGSGKGDSRGAARVYNNSTIRGLAARVANDLTAAGYLVVEVGNYSQGRIWTTTVYYQEGTDQRATAEAIGAEFGMRVEPRFAGIADAAPGLIVIVTNDYGA